MTQAERIENYIRMHGSITTFEAFQKLHITKLTTRISEMRRAGKQITAEKIKGVDDYGEPVFYNRYRIEG